jgi:hypothetical protein
MIPTVIVSDNSTANLPGIARLRAKYPISYVRQSGQMRMVDHHNACLKLVSTPWALFLHDDDELYPNVLGKLDSFLAGCGDVGVVVGGTEYIDQDGVTRGVWTPEGHATLKGEDGVLRLGLDCRAFPPSCVWKLGVFHEVGGFPDADGVGADYTLVLRLCYQYGATLLPAIIGRSRAGPQQATDYSTPERAEATLDLSIKMAQMTRSIGFSTKIEDQLVDYMTWWIFRLVTVSMLESHPFFVFRLCRKCVRVTPSDGAWQRRIRSEYPYLFWRPQWVAMLLFKANPWMPRLIKKTLRAFASHSAQA